MKDFTTLTPSAVRIVEAAEALIQSVGYLGFSYEDISQQVGIRKASIHHHFPTKAELGAVVAQRFTARFMTALEAIQGAEPGTLARLRAFAGLFEDTFQRERRLCLCGMLGAEAAGLPQMVIAEVATFFDRTLAWLSGVIREGLLQQEIKAQATPEALASLILAALEGSMILGRGYEPSHGPRHISETLLAGMLN